MSESYVPGFVAVCLLAGCASSTSAPRSAPPRFPETALKRVVPVDDRPGYRARLFVDPGSSISSDDWTEIVVLSTSEGGRRVCEVLAEHQMKILAGTDLRVSIARPCGIAPLPRMESVRGTYLLTNERAITDTDLLLLMQVEPADATDVGKATVTDFTAFANHDSCQQALTKIKAIRQQDRAMAAEDGRSWLEAQLRGQEEKVARACDEDHEVQTRCVGLGNAEDVEKACRASRQSKRCQEAQERAMARAMCEIERTRAERSCKTERSMAEELRVRAGKEQKLEGQDASNTVCQKL